MRNARIKTAVCVLAGIMLLIVFSVLAVQRCCTDLIRHTDAVDAAEKADALPAIAELEQTWAQDQRLLRLFISDQQMIELNAEIMQLRAHYEADTGELAAGLAAVKADLEWLGGQCPHPIPFGTR